MGLSIWKLGNEDFLAPFVEANLKTVKKSKEIKFYFSEEKWNNNMFTLSGYFM